MIALAVAASLAAGACVLSLLRVEPRTRINFVGYSFFAGVVALALWTHLLLFAAVPVRTWTVLLGPAILGAAALWKGRWPRPASTWGTWSLWSIPLVLSAALSLVDALHWHELDFDPLYFYQLKAESIVHHGTLWNPDFLDPARLHMAGRRPLLLPSIYADLHLLSGSADPRLLRLWFALLFLGTLAAVAERIRPPLPWFGVFALLPALWHPGGVATGYGDYLLGILLLLGVDGLRRRETASGAFWLAAAMLLKQDAWPFLIALPLATLLTRPREFSRAVALMAAPAAVAIAWVLLARRLPWSFDFRPDQFDPPQLVASIRHWPYVLRRVAGDLVRFDHWGTFWILWLAFFAHQARRLHRDDARWLLAALLQLLAYVAIMATFPDDEIEHATRIQKMRLMLHVVPLLWAWAAEKGREAVAIQPGPPPETAAERPAPA